MGLKLKPSSDWKAFPAFLKAGVIVGRRISMSWLRMCGHAALDTGIFEDKEMGERSFLVGDNEGNLIQLFTARPTK